MWLGIQWYLWKSGACFGAKFVLTFGVGSIAVKIVALIEDRAGIEPVLFFLGFVSLVWVLVILILIIRTPKVKPEQSIRLNRFVL